ncbi:probable cadmium-transporting ATPase [Acropora millepora]|uniref:probable cadmium-transporting ATPase n=1 Tax=Acropora millepora TaxID=45264 RepID=UPI001CF42AC4|nr:probable cadmium-transporting ATPase [Acropora millepora]
MCQEHDCDCCTDEWPEDACDCVECYHGVEDISVIQRDPCIEDRRLDVVEQLCNRFKNLNSPSGASTYNRYRKIHLTVAKVKLPSVAPIRATPLLPNAPLQTKTATQPTPFQPNAAQRLKTLAQRIRLLPNAVLREKTLAYLIPLHPKGALRVKTPPYWTRLLPNAALRVRTVTYRSPPQPNVVLRVKTLAHPIRLLPNAVLREKTLAYLIPLHPKGALRTKSPPYRTPLLPNAALRVRTVTYRTPLQPNVALRVKTPIYRTSLQAHSAMKVKTPTHRIPAHLNAALRIKTTTKVTPLQPNVTLRVKTLAYPTLLHPNAAARIKPLMQPTPFPVTKGQRIVAKIQVHGRDLVSRISITECSGFYPILLNLPQTPGVNTAGGSQNKPLQHTTKLRVHNICCALESKLVQETLEPLEGVTSIAVNVIGRVAYVRHDPEVTSASELISVLNRLHLGASIMETGSRQSDGKSDSLPPLLSSCFIYLLIQTVLVLIAVVAHFVKGASWYKWVAIAEIVVGIGPVLKKAFLSIKILSLDINILMLIAIVGTLAINDWLEGAGVVYVFTFAETLQEFCMYKVQRTISGLMLKAPQVAILASTGECIRVEEVALGTVIAIRPGELIPLDGKVLTGRASVDESSVSGESVPVEKTVGSKVYSGTVNQNGYLEVETTSDSTSSTVTKVAELVQEAQTGSANTELAINWFAKYYTPAVVIAAVLVIVIPAILGAAGVGSYSNEIKEWGRRSLVLLVIACPCALVMSTPIAVVCGITAAARKGSLIKGGVHLETLARLEVLAFDKTGTLTEGKFQVVDVECAFGVEEGATLRLAAALESKSSHPLAAAVVNKFSGCVAEMLTSESPSLPEVSRFQLHEGQGISGNVDGHVVQIGNREFLHRISANPLTASMEDNYISWSNESKTVIFVCVDNKLAMMISLADTVRPNSLLALDWLKKLRIQSAMITGDNSRTAMAVKARLGLDEFVAEMKPENKLKWITDRQAGVTDDDYDGKIECEQPERPCLPSWTSCRQYKFLTSRDKKKGIVGMVGDGVNDGPALAAANIGIAMGAGGTALAVEAADVALMSNNLSKIPELVELGRFCRLVVAENIAFSVILKLGIVIATLAGKTALWMAVVADVLGLLFVLLNGLRPLWWKVDGKRTFKKTQNEIPLNLNSEQDYSYDVSV